MTLLSQQSCCRQKADLAVAPLTISSHRQTAVDFTQPFMDLGLSILIENNINEDYKVFSFLKPFNTDLWIAIVVSTILVGFFLWLHATFSPRGYHGRIAQSRDHNNVREDHWRTRECLRIFESTWSSFSYAAGQGADVAHPESTSGRVVVAFWWFAMLIISKMWSQYLKSNSDRFSLWKEYKSYNCMFLYRFVVTWIKWMFWQKVSKQEP